MFSSLRKNSLVPISAPGAVRECNASAPRREQRTKREQAFMGSVWSESFVFAADTSSQRSLHPER